MIDLATCLHEAAHGLALYLLGGTIKSIEVCGPWNDSSNICHHPGLFTERFGMGHPLSKSAMTCTLAGPCAEWKYTGKQDLAVAGPDLQIARISLKAKGWENGLDDAAFFETFGENAKRFVAHPIRWKMIEAFAEELQQRRRMTGQEAVTWINQAAEKLPASQILELMFPDDKLGGDMLPVHKHGG
jgi:hypothetical protein